MLTGLSPIQSVKAKQRNKGMDSRLPLVWCELSGDDTLINPMMAARVTITPVNTF